ncbi:S-layer homology domain-containing protein [Bacillus tuaregi]|uniref:S-layer homology domain-containing protein n=1 Tax=Bacillus tuaregi TaxID=1816695 RepID=UPI0008F8C84A|nr:S-layer homology domain-containing protein [Bacillus tuaregi]
MKRYKYFLVLPILFLLGMSVITSQADAAELSFTDYQKDNFGYASVSQLVSEGIIQGYKDNSFKPDRAVKRIETAVMFKRALPIEAAISGSGFKDVPDTSEFAQATAAVKTAGIFKGSSNGTFGPNDLLTREQMASVIVRAFDLEPVSDVNVTLTDLNQVSTAHVDDVKVLFQNGITKGKNNGAFDPKGSVSRAEFSVFLHRALQNFNGENPDNGIGTPPIGNIPGGPGQMDQTKPDVRNTELIIDSSSLNGQLSSTDNGIQITYNLKNQSPESIIKEGTINVSEASTLSITKAPNKVMLVLGNDTTQQLTQGSNILSFTDKLSLVDISQISDHIGNFTVEGKLTDHAGNSKDITISFIVK